jgi:predicted Zn-dependent protease
MARWRRVFLGYITGIVLVGLAGCVVSGGGVPERGGRLHSSPDIRHVDSSEAQRLYHIMTPLLRVMDHPESAREVSIGIIDDQEINAANAGNGQFYVTTALFEKANNEELRGVMAHEIAHEDLGHVAQTQILGAGLNLGVILLEELLPGSSAITPIAGSLIARGYTRSEEYAADRHAVEILRRAGYSKRVMIDTLMWVERSATDSRGGGFLSTHPATQDRIERLRELREVP